MTSTKVHIKIDKVPKSQLEIDIECPTPETWAAMQEANQIAHDSSIKRYYNVEDALKALKK